MGVMGVGVVGVLEAAMNAFTVNCMEFEFT